MAKQSKVKYVILTPKNDEAKKRLEYHGTRWVYRGMQAEVKYTREPGPYFRLQSRDGNKCIFVKERDDRDFIVRMAD